MIDENISLKAQHGLQELGLTEKESLVYMALLKLGQVGSSKIISATDLHGQFVYQALGTLEKKGLVQYVVVNGRKRFHAHGPETLTALIEQKRHLANETSALLKQALIIPEAQALEVFQGEDSFIAHEFSLLHDIRPDDTLLIIGGHGDRFTETLGSQLGSYEAQRRKKGVRVRYIGSENQRPELEKNAASRSFFEYRLLPGLFTGMVNTNIWPHAIAFNIFGQPVVSIALKDQTIATSYRGFFETLWKIGSR